MPTISLCMIVKNEEMHLARCLDSVAELVDEIIIVDTGRPDSRNCICLYFKSLFVFVEGRFFRCQELFFF